MTALYRAMRPKTTGAKKPLGFAAARRISDPMTDLTHLEEKIAHLTRTVDDLSDIVARQEGEIDRLTHRVRMLMEREASREADSSGGIPLADQRPPHW